jgi:site-specific DNA recombinase
MRAALYLRKSTDEHQAESLETQEAGGRAFCQARGMTVVRVVVDSGISRAEMVKRPGLAELQSLAATRAIDAVVTRDPSRLAGDTFRGGLAIETLLESGCRLFFYFTGREVDATDDTWKVTTALDGWRSELDRKATAGRTREHLERKAARGLNVGGRVYGYRNVRVFELPDGQGRQLRTEYAIDEAQAEVVRDIYRAYAKGEGYRGIAKLLNERGVPSPRAGKRGTGSWDQSSVRVILLNERYLGRLVWGRTGSMYRGGTRESTKPAKATWTTVERPELRIVPAELEREVVERREASARLYSGRTALQAPRPKYLLGGLARCGGCGGPMHVHNQRRGRVQVKSYGCKYNHTRGRAVCSVNTRRPIAGVDATVLEWFVTNVLSPAFVRAVMGEVRRQLAEQLDTSSGDADQIAAYVARLRGEVSRLIGALANVADKPEAVIVLIGEKEKQLRAAEARLAAMRSAPGAIMATLDQMEARAEERLADLRSSLMKPGHGRSVLATVLDGPLQLHAVETPDGKRFEIVGRYALGGLLLTESVATSTAGVPSGFPPVEIPRIAGEFRIVERAA